MANPANPAASPSRCQRRAARHQHEPADQAQGRRDIQQRAAQRRAEFQTRHDHEQIQAQAKMATLPIHNEHAAGIDVGDSSH